MDGSPGWSAVKNLPASGGGLGLIPGPGRYLITWYLSLCTKVKPLNTVHQDSRASSLEPGNCP